MKPGNVDSHIQMPRFLLSRFENENHSFFYYDISKGFIGTNGHAKTLNTEHGYYPNEIEKLLSDEIEKPFSQILRFIDLLDLEQPSFTMNTIDENNIKQFLISLIVRSPLFIDSIGKKSVFFDFFSQTDQHAIAILQGMQEAQKLKLFDDYRVTFTVNKTKKPFILPISGLYFYRLNGFAHATLPVSPHVALSLIEASGIPFIEKEGITRLYLVMQEKHITKLNRFALQEQCKQNYGYVISPVKDALEELLPMC